jgi:hypothetical protein
MDGSGDSSSGDGHHHLALPGLSVCHRGVLVRSPRGYGSQVLPKVAW